MRSGSRSGGRVRSLGVSGRVGEGRNVWNWKVILEVKVRLGDKGDV